MTKRTKITPTEAEIVFQAGKPVYRKPGARSAYLVLGGPEMTTWAQATRVYLAQTAKWFWI